jgi:hypothetical protein
MYLKGKKYLFQTVLFLSALIALFSSTNPNSVSIAFLLLPVILIFLIFYSGINFVLVNISKLEPRTRFLNAFTMGAGLTLLVVLSSVGSLSVYDLLAAVFFIGISAIYIKKSIR